MHIKSYFEDDENRIHVWIAYSTIKSQIKQFHAEQKESCDVLKENRIKMSTGQHYIIANTVFSGIENQMHQKN